MRGGGASATRWAEARPGPGRGHWAAAGARWGGGSGLYGAWNGRAASGRCSRGSFASSPAGTRGSPFRQRRREGRERPRGRRGEPVARPRRGPAGALLAPDAAPRALPPRTVGGIFTLAHRGNRSHQETRCIALGKLLSLVWIGVVIVKHVLPGRA